MISKSILRHAIEFTSVSGPAGTENLQAILGNVATGGEVVRSDGQRTGANEAVAGRAASRVAVVALQTLLAVVARRAVLAFVAHARHRIARRRVSCPGSDGIQ